MRYCLVVAFALTVISPHALGQKDISINTIDKIKRSIVPILCGYTDDKGAFQVVEIVGSGFFVDLTGRFLTAGHLLDNWDRIAKEKHSCSPAFYVPDRGWKRFERNIPMQWFSFTDCVRDSAVDLAVCQPVENPFESHRVSRATIEPITFDTHEWAEGTPVAFSGFPLQSVRPITSKGYIAGFMGNNVGFDYLIDKNAWPGASGSLVYLANGKVVGIILMSGLNEGAGLTVARGASTILDFLSKHPAAVNRQQSKNPANN